MASNNQNDCLIQSEKFSIENVETVEEYYREEGENLLAEFQSP